MKPCFRPRIERRGDPLVKVLQLISSGGLYGAENMVLQLALALKGIGCETTIGVFKNAHRTSLAIADIATRRGLQVEVIDCQGRIDQQAVRKIQRCVTNGCFDVLHTHGYKANFYGYWAMRDSCTAIVGTAHNWPGSTATLRLYAALDRRVLRHFDYVCAVSEEICIKLLGARLPSTKVSVIENGIDVQELEEGQPSLKREFGLEHNLVVGFVGRLAKEKGLEYLLRAIPAVLSECPDARFVLVGEGPERGRVERLIAEGHLEETVFLAGRRSDLANVYASFDIFVLPSVVEGMPLVVLEAMAAGKPMVATRVGAIPKVVEDKSTSFLVEPGDWVGLGQELCQLLKDSILRQEFGRQGRAIVREKFSSGVMAERYLGVYRRVVSERSRAAVPQRTTAGVGPDE